MAARPSIKGSVFAGVVEDVTKLLASGRASREEAARWLEPADFALLEEPVVITRWYDIHAYARMGTLLRDVEGEGSNEYLRDLGRKTARRLLESGLYSQLEYLHRTEVADAIDGPARVSAFGRDLRLLTTLSASILNFSRWTVHPDSKQAARYRITVTEARDFPEVLAWRSDGFVNEMATQHGQPDLWCWERAASDQIVFRMVRDEQAQLVDSAARARTKAALELEFQDGKVQTVVARGSRGPRPAVATGGQGRLL